MSASHRMRNLSFVIATVLTAGLAAQEQPKPKLALQGKRGLTDVAGACEGGRRPVISSCGPLWLHQVELRRQGRRMQGRVHR